MHFSPEHAGIRDGIYEAFSEFDPQWSVRDLSSW
jgi:hypothetical protein